MNSLFQCFAVGIAGFFGAVARMLIGRLCAPLGTFPIGTMIINVGGSFVLGWFLAFAASRSGISETTRLAIAVGFLGTFTTFSTWMYESSQQLSQGQHLGAAINVIGSVVLGLAAISAGAWLGHH